MWCQVKTGTEQTRLTPKCTLYINVECVECVPSACSLTIYGICVWGIQLWMWNEFYSWLTLSFQFFRLGQSVMDAIIRCPFLSRVPQAFFQQTRKTLVGYAVKCPVMMDLASRPLARAVCSSSSSFQKTEETAPTTEREWLFHYQLLLCSYISWPLCLFLLWWIVDWRWLNDKGLYVSYRSS